MSGNLLEDLAGFRNCFISSLKDGAEADATFCALLEMDLEQYSIEECNYCLTYILNREFRCRTHAEVRKFLQDAVSG